MYYNSYMNVHRDGNWLHIECDENIRSNDEVLIVNEEDKLLAYGKSLISAVEINNFQTGQAIKTRKGFKK